MNKIVKKQNFLFRRQFAILLKQIDILGLDNWIEIIFNSYKVIIHPDLLYYYLKEGDREVLLLGYITNILKTDLSNQEIIKDLIDNSKDLDTFIEQTHICGGRWAILYKDLNNFAIFNDATGMRQIFYDDKIQVIASNENLLAHLLNLKKSDYVQNSFVLKFNDKSINEIWFPYNKTNYDEIKCLIPNYYLDILACKIYRFWPLKRYFYNYKDLISKLHEYLIGNVKSFSNQFDKIALAVTSGYDSRNTLGYFMNFSKADFILYTFKYQYVDDTSDDIVIPQKLSHYLNLKHLLISHYKDIDPEFEKIFSIHNAIVKPIFISIAYNMYREYPDDFISVQSVANEVVRQRYPYLPFIPDILDICHFTKFYNFKFAENAFKEWLDNTRKIAKDLKIKLEDLFFMEQRMGRWNSGNRNEWDIVQEVFEPWNVREIWLISMSIAGKYKKHNNNKVYYDLFKSSWKNYNIIEITTKKDINYKYYKFRKLLSKFKRIITAYYIKYGNKT